MIQTEVTMPVRISAMIEAEIVQASRDTQQERAILHAFKDAQVEPHETLVTFSGGAKLPCWTVTRSDGAYRVVYLPNAECFSLCAESAFGPLDIGVQGPALGCFASV